MTNKLRSVIDELYDRSAIVTSSEGRTQTVHMVYAKDAIYGVLDAIIEEIEKIKETVMQKHSDEEDYLHGYCNTIDIQLIAIKQARAEISTSLTQ